ncbi:MAG TPA: O-antigen ligase family protein [Gemmatimonadaceae bacterium]|nr:O-antigen ligase family protein [Gemmatimonadaceae bacterium]
MSGLLLSLWIATIAADRIDMLGGHGAFILTPFLALTPLVMASELARHQMRARAVRLSRGAILYALLGAALVTVVVTSVLVADDFATSASRASLLVADITATFAVAILSADREDLPTVLARGALLAFVLFFWFDVTEALWFIGRGPESMRIGSVIFHFDALQNAGPLPRLAGPVGDGNRAGFVLVFYAALIAAGERRAWLRRASLGLIVLFFLATASRSASMAGVAAFTMAALTGGVKLSPVALLVTTMVVGAAAVVVLAKPNLVKTVLTTVERPLAERVSTGEGSASSHVELIERGVSTATESIPHAFIGIGFGDAFRVLQDMFPGNRYGNFHSLYVTMFAESGIVALAITLVLLCGPLFVGGAWRPLIAGAIAFNIFYQATAEPVFWFLLAMAWRTMPLFQLHASIDEQSGASHRATLRAPT